MNESAPRRQLGGRSTSRLRATKMCLACDGRFSKVRAQAEGGALPPPRVLDVANFKFLVPDTTRGLSCRRWRRRIVSSCREHRLNPMHRWKKQSAASIRYTTARHQLGLMVLIWRRQTDG